MDTAAIRITGRAWLAVAALALLLAPICVRADDSPSDRHEIPTFVLKRIELPPGADASARIAAEAARPGTTR